MSNPTVFLSCRREDASQSEPVRRALEEAQLTIVENRDGISTAGLFVACVSANGYVAEEVEIAIAMLQRLERIRWWLLVVPIDNCEVPALPITPKVTLRDLRADLDEIPLRLAPKQSRGILITETETQRLMASRGVIVGAQVTEPAGGDQHSKTKFSEVVIDNEVTFIGTVIGKRTE